MRIGKEIGNLFQNTPLDSAPAKTVSDTRASHMSIRTEMGKPQYIQKFRNAWVEKAQYKDWLKPVSNNLMKAYCKFCKCEFNARLADIEKHRKSKKHNYSSQPFNPQRQTRINVVDASKNLDPKKLAEAALALYSAMHGNMNTIDHLSNLCTLKFSESDAAEVQLHRTKCTQIIKNVLSPYFQDCLRNDVGDKKFSLLLDESTDISVTKFLGIVIRYYSEKGGTIVSTFLALAELTSGTAEAILEAIERVANSFTLDLHNLIGIGTDNASVMVGVNNGLFVLLKNKYNLLHLVLIRCICHSLQLAVSHATTETLPRNLEFLIRETYNWFAHSSLRQIAYKEIYGLINEGAAPLKILQLSGTRWISIEPAIDRILNQWDELKTHFEIVKRKEACYTAEMLYNNYKDTTNKVYLTYIHSILIDVQRTNKSFQSASADPSKLLEDLKNLVLSVSSKILIPTARINIFTDNISRALDPNSYLGYAFEKALTEMDSSSQNKKILKDRCIAFTTKLCTELRNRLPTNLVLLGEMKLLHPTESLKARAHKIPITNLVKQFISQPKQIDKIETQWVNLTNIQWSNVSSSADLWNEVSKYRDACGDNSYRELSDFALQLLSLPYSNADIERVFSQLNIVKNKLRNRLASDTTNAILHVRYGLKRSGKCCFSYELPKDVLSKIGTLQAYGIQATASNVASTSSIIPVENSESDTDLYNMAELLFEEL